MSQSDDVKMLSLIHATTDRQTHTVTALRDGLFMLNLTDALTLPSLYLILDPSQTYLK